MYMSAPCSLSWRTIGSVNELSHLLAECVCVCVHAAFACAFSPSEMRVRGEKSIDLRASSTWCEGMSDTRPDLEQFSFCYITGSAIDIRECARPDTPADKQSGIQAVLLLYILCMSQSHSIDSLFKRLQS